MHKFSVDDRLSFLTLSICWHEMECTQTIQHLRTSQIMTYLLEINHWKALDILRYDNIKAIAMGQLEEKPLRYFRYRTNCISFATRARDRVFIIYYSY